MEETKRPEPRAYIGMDGDGLIATIASACYAIWSEYKRGTDRATMHRFLIGLKPSIQGPNQASVLKAIDDTLEWLQPPKKRQDEARKSA